jgi:hypothetical protein
LEESLKESKNPPKNRDSSKNLNENRESLQESLSIFERIKDSLKDLKILLKESTNLHKNPMKMSRIFWRIPERIKESHANDKNPRENNKRNRKLFDGTRTKPEIASKNSFCWYWNEAEWTTKGDAFEDDTGPRGAGDKWSDFYFIFWRSISTPMATVLNNVSPPSVLL